MRNASAGAVHPALDSADRAMEMVRGFFIGAPIHEDEGEGGAIRLRQVSAGSLQFVATQVPFLVGRHAALRGGAFFRAQRLALPEAKARAEGVAHDREQPGFHLGALFELADAAKRPDERFLYE